MSRHWASQFHKLQLSKSERQILAKFEADPEGIGFLPLADVLKAHKLYDEALELMSEGVARHPNYVMGRVALARDLLQRGQVEASWQYLEDAPLDARSNALCQKLRLKLALLKQDALQIEKAEQVLKAGTGLDQESRALLDLLAVSGSDAARHAILRDMQDRNIKTDLDLSPATDMVPPPPPNLAGKARQIAHALSPVTLSEHDETEVRGFHVVPLGEIFRPSDDPGIKSGAVRGDTGIELDTITMAELYERQGHFAKALEVYRRLLRLSPNQEQLRRKVGELTKLDREQKDFDLTVDPALVDRLEAIEIIDRQAKFYESLLEKLS